MLAKVKDKFICESHDMIVNLAGHFVIFSIRSNYIDKKIIEFNF